MYKAYVYYAPLVVDAIVGADPNTLAPYYSNPKGIKVWADRITPFVDNCWKRYYYTPDIP